MGIVGFITNERSATICRAPNAPGLMVVTLAFASVSCGGMIPMAGAGGPVPLDSARAVAVAQRNVCGRSLPPSDTTCVVRKYSHVDGRYVVTMDRHPPAGNDRLIVTLFENGERIVVTPVDSTTRKPPP
jgi:hypothetical protein